MKTHQSYTRRASLAACLFASLLSVAALPIGAAAPAKSWTITTLPSTGLGATGASINNRGEVGGLAKVVPPGTTNWYNHAVIWQNGSMFDLGAQISDWRHVPPGYTFTQVSVINDRGTAALSGYPGLQIYKDGVLTPLGIEYGIVNDMNNRDVIVGSFQYGVGPHAFMYSDGVVHDLGTLGGPYASANAINDRGVIVGSSYVDYDPTRVRAFVWENGVMRDLGTLGGQASNAVDINSHGVIIGQAQDASGAWQPFILDRYGMRRLENVPSNATLIAINDRGVVLGSYPNANFQGQTQFIWEDGVVTKLDTLPEVKAAGWGSIFVMDMNDRGWITGWGWKTGGSPNGEAFVLAPK